MRILTILLSLICGIARADTVHLAVASNFVEPAKAIAERFEKETGHEVILSFGSSGKLYAQIVNGAPFDVFLSADVEKPAKLVEQGLASGQFTYAVGRLVLWQRELILNSLPVEAQLAGEHYTILAMANPKTAPYGKAAMETLENLRKANHFKVSLDGGEIVIGENIAQAFQFVDSGNAGQGFVALSQIISLGEDIEGSTWIVPEEYHNPIKQDAVLVKDTEASRAFIEYLQSEPIWELISNSGYEMPK